jgi:hypothetical protein
VRAAELQELVDIWKERGLKGDLAQEVAEALTAHDPVRTAALAQDLQRRLAALFMLRTMCTLLK